MKLAIWDERMLKLMDNYVANNYNGQGAIAEFLQAIGIKSASTLKQIRDGKQSFRHNHLLKAGQKFGISMDYFYGFTDKMPRTNRPVSGMELLKEATRLIEAEMKQSEKVNKKVNKIAQKGAKLLTA